MEDTSPETLEVWLRLQRDMPVGQKLFNVLEAGRFVLQMYEAGVRAQYPEADDREVLLRVASRHLDPETMIRAYGWDPVIGRSMSAGA
jgi:hypothetical protein